METATTDPRNLLLHNGTVTIESPRGGHRTFRVRTQRDDSAFAPGQRVAALLAGPENDSDDSYQGFVFARDDGSYVVWRTKRRSAPTDPPSAWEVYADMLARPWIYEARGYRYLASRSCRRCNRRLTTPGSIEAGIGPECSTK